MAWRQGEVWSLDLDLVGFIFWVCRFPAAKHVTFKRYAGSLHLITSYVQWK